MNCDVSVISMHTDNYCDDAVEMLATLKIPGGFECGESRRIDDRGQWVYNTNQKPRVILEEISKGESRAVVWVDADARFKKEAYFFFSGLLERRVDIAYFYKADTKEVLTGTLFFRDTSVVRSFLDSWRLVSIQRPSHWDQWNFQIILDRYKASDFNLKIELLPIEYCAIFDHKDVQNIDPVIVHLQRSRSMR